MTSWTNDYAEGVCDGSIPAGEWVRLACRRHLDDLEREDFAYRFDEKLALRVVRFIETLPHTKGKWAAKGERLKLQPWQKFIVGCIFGWVRKSDGLRRFREAYLEIPRKNGKSVLAAAIGLYMLVADGECGAEVYSGATSEKQAWEVFRPGKLMAQRSPALLERFGLDVNAASLLRMEDFSRFEPLIGKPGDGASPNCAIVDEYHEHADSDQFDTMQTGMGAREQPLMLAITTAGGNMGGPCYEKRLEAQRILRKDVEDERFFSVIYGIDKGDDWKDPEIWAKANPNLGVSVFRDYLEAQVFSAIRSAERQNSVKTKHFNVWVGAKSAWLNMEHWNNAADPDLREEDFSDALCCIGLDLATRIDICGVVRLFAREIDGKTHYYAFPRLYLPEEALISAKNATTYRGWAADGYLTVHDGAETSYSRVQEDIEADVKAFQVSEVVYDPWQATQMAQNLREGGIESVEMPNNAKNLSPAMRDLEAALASGRFHHPDNKVLNWMAGNVVAAPDAKDNLFPRKETNQSHQKIDGIVALLYAWARAMHFEDTGSMDDFLNNVVVV